MMTIYINARWLLNSPSGVERYAYQITRALHNAGAPIVLICPKCGKINKVYHLDGMSLVRYGIGKSHLWEQCILPWFFVGKHEDILLSLIGLGSILVKRKVMTVHDLSFLHNPSWFSRWYFLYYRLMMPWAIRTSQHIITVSNFSKNEIQHHYPWVKDHKITIAPCAVDTNVFTPSNKARENFVLAVSSMDPRKNFQRLVSALNHTNISLTIAGDSKPIFAKMHLVPDQNITLVGHVNDTELVQLYHSAAAFVFPSLYEGFGIPPLEAMACGCPVIVSDIDVLHEVCGNAAIYCNPTDENNIQQAIRQILNYTTEERQACVQAGYQNIKRYTWGKSAKFIYQSIQKLCKS